ncbi:MAG TPA: VWA domain-containing protein [Acidimicrobiales bacterium]|nr:VWA domain-containing protein [Acidimicrobiales bacterium]
MADFTAQIFQNEYLPDGGTDVHAIVTVGCSGAGVAGQTGGGAAAEIVIIDTSGSMQGEKIHAARQAAAVAVGEIVDGTWFAVIAGTDSAGLVYPDPRQGRAMAGMDAGTRQQATEAVKLLDAGGGTAIGSWLDLAREAFDSVEATQRHAILLTDGKDQSERHSDLVGALARAKGKFQCDCRGVGEDWVVSELRLVATELLGTVDLIADPAQMEADFEQLMRSAMGRGVADVTLRVWAPQGAEVLFVRQVSPSIDDLSGRRAPVNALTGAYPTGSWGDESRDYHVAVRVPAKALGNEQLAARVQVTVGDDVLAQGLVKAIWSDDSALTTRINPAVAHYTGQAELAQVIQEGLAAKADGDDATATAKLGRAAQLAAQTGNDEATNRLRKVVDIDDADTGTVRLKRQVAKLDEMALDTASTKTTRVHS